MQLAGSVTLTAGMGSVAVMIVSLVIIVLLITWGRINPVYSMLVGALGAGIAFGIPLTNQMTDAGLQHGVVQTVIQGFGATIGNIGIVILLGCTIGVILEQTGGALVIANSMLKLVGPRNASLAMMFSGYLISIPVFSDTAIVIMAPVARTVSARSGVPLMACLGALNAGIMATHTIVPPTPGPLAAAGTLGVDLGQMFAVGAIVALAYSVVAWIYCAFFAAKKFPRPDEVPGIEPLPKGKKLTAEDLMIKTDKKLPSTFISYAALLVPILLICFNSFGTMGANPLIPPEARPFFGFIGHPIVALGIGVLVAFCLDTTALSRDQINKWFTKSIDTSAFIILATGTAGSYGFILRVSGVGEFMGNAIAATALPAIFIPFFVTLLLVLSNGSATVSLITGSAIMYPMLPGMAAAGVSPLMVAMALTAGASFFYHVNASHYWVVVKSANLSMKEGFFNVSGGTGIGSIGAMVAVVILNMFF